MISEYDMKRLLKYFIQFKNKIVLNNGNDNVKFEDINNLIINSYLKLILCYYISKLKEINKEYIAALLNSDDFINSSFFDLLSLFYGFKLNSINEKINNRFKLYKINYSASMKELNINTYNLIMKILNKYNSLDISILGEAYERIISNLLFHIDLLLHLCSHCTRLSQ